MSFSLLAMIFQDYYEADISIRILFM